MTVLSHFYPFTLILIIILTIINNRRNLNKKSNIFFDAFFKISIFVYILSFMVNYPFELFLIVWFVRDILIFIIAILIWFAFKRFKIITLTILILSIGFFLYQKYNINTSQENIDFKYDNSAELLFDIKDKKQITKIEGLLKKYNAEIIQAFPQVKDTAITELDDYYTIDVDEKVDLKAVIKDLDNSNLIDWIERNDTYKLFPHEKQTKEYSNKNKDLYYSLNDPSIPNQWSFNYTDINKLLILLKNKKPIKKARIFILDTGVDSEHEDLLGNYISLSDKYDYDTDKHGTHCAGVACALSNNHKGIASLNLTGEFTSITSITVLPKGYGSLESIIDGIILAADNGADVISMSLGGVASQEVEKLYEEAIKYANKKGAIIVVAAGNENKNAKTSVPASCEGVITVSAVDKDLKIANFSNYVSEIKYKIAAPGVNIYSTTPYNDYEYMNGTSMATPYVAGLIGLMKSINPDLTTSEVFRILNTTGINTKDTKKTGKYIQPIQALRNLELTEKKSSLRSFLKRLLIFKIKKQKTKIETVHKYIHQIKATDNIPLKKYPNFNSLTLSIIDKNSSCLQIEEGAIETIGDTTDYWYKVKYRNVTGWIFGNHTSEKLETREFIVQKLPFEYKEYDLNEELMYYKKDWLKRGGEIGLLSYDGIFPLGWGDNGDFCYIKIVNDYLPSDVYLEIISLKNGNKSYLINHFDFEQETIYPQIPDSKFYDFRRNHIKDAYNTTITEKEYKISRLLEENNIKISRKFSITRTIVENNMHYSLDLELTEYHREDFFNKANIYLNKNGKRKMIREGIPCGYSDDSYCYFIDNPYSNIKAILFVNLEQSLDEEHLRNQVILVNIEK